MQTREISFTLQPIRDWREPAYWGLASFLGVLLGMLSVNQIVEANLFSKNWGIFAFASSALGGGLYWLLHLRQKPIRGGAGLIGLSTLAVALAAPEIVFSLPDLNPQSFGRGFLIQVFSLRYACCLLGMWGGWALARTRLKRQVDPWYGSIILMAAGTLLPLVFLYLVDYFWRGSLRLAEMPATAVTATLVGCCVGALLVGQSDSISPKTPVPRWQIGTIVAVLGLFAYVGYAFQSVIVDPVEQVFITNPGGVSVYEGEKEIGVSDSKGYLKLFFPAPRSALLTLVKSGFEPQSQTFSLSKQGNKPLEVTLTPTYCDLVWQTSPPAVDVTVNGVRQGKSAVTGAFRLPKQKVDSRVELVFSKENYLDHRMTIQRVPKQSTYDLGLIKMSPLTGKLRITTRPPRAKVFIDGQLYGESDAEGIIVCTDLPTGKALNLKVEKPGWVTQDRSNAVTLTKDRLNPEVLVELDRLMMDMEVRTVPCALKACQREKS